MRPRGKMMTAQPDVGCVPAGVGVGAGGRRLLRRMVWGFVSRASASPLWVAVIHPVLMIGHKLRWGQVAPQQRAGGMSACPTQR
jgi:hypothetical protein